jgi:subtilase family serine protease
MLMGGKYWAVASIVCGSFFAGGICLSQTVVRSPESKPAPSRISVGAASHAVASGQAKLSRPLDPQQPIRITIVPRSPNREELTQRIAEMLDPHSREFHKFLTFDQWKQRYAPSDADVQAIEQWATGAGLTEVHRFRTNHALVFDGSTDLVNRIFSITMNQYQIGATTYFANDRKPTLEPKIASKIDNVLGLSSIETMDAVSSPRRGDAMSAQELKDAALPHIGSGPYEQRIQSAPAAALPPSTGPRRLPTAIREKLLRPEISGPQGGTLLEPNDLWSAQGYNYFGLSRLSHCCNPNNAPGGSPPETSIAIIGRDVPQLSDIQTALNLYGIIPNITIDGINSPACCEDELTLDAEWSGAMAGNADGNQSAHQYIYGAGGHTLGDILSAYEAALSDDKARIASVSYGRPEDDYGGIFSTSISQFRDVTNAMVAQGWTVVVSAGDDGAYSDCSSLSVLYPASDPNAIAVGGTDLSLTLAPGLTFQSETSWTGTGCTNGGTNLGGGGGGCSNTFFAPKWSSGLAACADNRRAVPDLSLNAAQNGVGGNQVFYYLGAWTSGSGGTSIATPEIAGFFAQENSYRLWIGRSGNVCGPANNAPCGAAGQVAAALYAAGSAPHNPFYDINDSSCNGGGVGPGYCTTPGYDKSTGWGSANMLQLAWAINFYLDGAGAQRPAIHLHGPATNTWYATDQTISFSFDSATLGMAGYTAVWDTDSGDPATGSRLPPFDPNNPFWSGPRFVGGTSGTLSLAAAKVGCHTAYIRGWDNAGQQEFSGAYGQFCYGQLANCQMTLTCAAPVHAPPQYTVSCPAPVDFYQVAADGSESFLENGLSVSGLTSTYGGGIEACQTGTMSCNGFSTYLPVSSWCDSGGSGGSGGTCPPGDPKKCCEACRKAGGDCHPNPKGGCLCF